MGVHPETTGKRTGTCGNKRSAWWPWPKRRANMRTRVRVIQGRLAESEPHRTSAIEAAYQHFRLDKQGSLVSPKTLRHYEWTIRPFLRWLDEEHPEVMRFEQLSVEMVRQYRVDMSQRLTTRGRLPDPATLNDLHRLLITFLRWAEIGR